MVQHIERGWSFFNEESERVVLMLLSTAENEREMVSRHRRCGHPTRLLSGYKGEYVDSGHTITALAYAYRPRRDARCSLPLYASHRLKNKIPFRVGGLMRTINYRIR